jgi:hypothetical protein
MKDKPAKIECCVCHKKPIRRSVKAATNNNPFRPVGFVLEGYDDGTVACYCRGCIYVKYGIDIKATADAIIAKDEAHEGRGE